MTWHDMTWHDMTWHDMTWHDMTWHDMTWHDMTCGGWRVLLGWIFLNNLKVIDGHNSDSKFPSCVQNSFHGNIFCIFLPTVSGNNNWLQSNLTSSPSLWVELDLRPHPTVAHEGFMMFMFVMVYRDSSYKMSFILVVTSQHPGGG